MDEQVAKNDVDEAEAEADEDEGAGEELGGACAPREVAVADGAEADDGKVEAVDDGGSRGAALEAPVPRRRRYTG